MKPWKIVKAITDHGIQLLVTGEGELEVTAPNGALTPGRVQFLRDYKSIIVEQVANFQSVELLFEIYNVDDRVSVVEQINKLSGLIRMRTIEQYLDENRKGASAEPNVIKKANAGRYRANAWLRETLDS